MKHGVTIVGGGLAGLGLGLGLRHRGVEVRVVEAGNYPRHRVCGEFIAGVGAAVLDDLQVSAHLTDALRLSTVTWFRGSRLVRQDRLPEPAWGLSRHVLDLRLAEAFRAAGGDLATGQRVASEGGEGRETCGSGAADSVVEGDVEGASRGEAASGEGVVWACGRRAKRYPSLGKSRKSVGSSGEVEARWWPTGDRAPKVGLKAHFLGLSLRADLEMHLGPTGYAGVSRLPDGAVNVCGLFSPVSLGSGLGVERLRSAIEATGLIDLAERLAEATVVPGSFCSVAGLDYGPPPGGSASSPWALGDRAGLIPPFTGNGMSLAFESAHLSVAPLAAYAEGKLPWAAALARYQQAWRRQFAGRLQRARLLHDWLLHPIGQPLFASWARARWFPFGPLYRLTH